MHDVSIDRPYSFGYDAILCSARMCADARERIRFAFDQRETGLPESKRVEMRDYMLMAAWQEHEALTRLISRQEDAS